MADAHEVRGQDVEHEAAGELGAGQGEDLGAVAVFAVAPAETDVSGGEKPRNSDGRGSPGGGREWPR